MDTITNDVKKLVKKAENLPAEFEHIEIKTPADYINSGEFLKEIKNKQRELEKKKAELMAPIREAGKKLTEFFQKPLDAIAKAERLIKSAMLVYEEKEEARRAEEERKLREKARKEEEAKKKALDGRIAKAQAAGKEDKVEELQQKKEEVRVVAPVIPQAAELKIAGVETREVWKYEITDEKKLPRAYLMPNLKAIGEIVRATKGSMQIEGVRIYSEKTKAA